MADSTADMNVDSGFREHNYPVVTLRVRRMWLLKMRVWVFFFVMRIITRVLGFRPAEIFFETDQKVVDGEAT